MRINTSIFRRPPAVRCESSTSRGPGSAWIVRSSGSSGLLGAASGLDELVPGIEDGDEGAEGPPLGGLAVIGLGAAPARFRPVALQALRSRARFHDGDRQQLQAGLGGERDEVQILPDGAAGGRVELV